MTPIFSHGPDIITRYWLHRHFLPSSLYSRSLGMRSKSLCTKLGVPTVCAPGYFPLFLKFLGWNFLHYSCPLLLALTQEVVHLASLVLISFPGSFRLSVLRAAWSHALVPCSCRPRWTWQVLAASTLPIKPLKGKLGFRSLIFRIGGSLIYMSVHILITLKSIATRWTQRFITMPVQKRASLTCIIINKNSYSLTFLFKSNCKMIIIHIVCKCILEPEMEIIIIKKERESCV